MATNIGKPTLQTFLSALVKNWASAVSGGLSVPFTILAIYLTNPNTKAIFAVLATCGVLTASYQLWALERGERVKIQEKLTGKSGLRCLPDRLDLPPGIDSCQLWVTSDE
jgi:hypothetical protein